MRRAHRQEEVDMQTMKKRVAQVLIGAVGLASVATAGVALAANGGRSGPSPSTGKTPTVASTDDRRGHDPRGQHQEPGDDRGQHQEPGDDHGQHQEPGDDHGGNSGPGGNDQGGHGDNSGPGSDG
jgi:hypothetical protein